MSRFLLEAYDALTEIALWLLFIGAAVAGYYAAGIGGVIGFVVGAFIISVFLVAPFMMISDIRKTVARIEMQRTQNSTSSSITSAQMQPVGGHVTSTNSQVPNKATGHIKNYKGHELTRGDGGVYVDGNQFSNVLEAEKWVNEQVKNS